MATNGEQETLDRILEELKRNDPARRLGALQKLNELGVSSTAILVELERLALKGEGEVQRAALAALSSRTSQLVASRRAFHPKFDRNLILNEIDQWQKDELIEPPQAEVLRRRYDFDLKPAAPLPSVPEKFAKESEASIAALPDASLERINKLQGVSRPLTPAGPRPSLMQTLLSESSIRIYLYLGAFFVIAAALILAAVVEAARLPILAAATLAFGGSALVFRKRLAQPSFALFIVFSFLLPIDANVFEETVGFREPSLSLYWTFVLLAMAAIWGLSVWFYESRFFSAVAFVSLSLAFYRVGKILRDEVEFYLFLGMLASLAGLAGVFLLKKWRDTKFSLLVFLLAQVQVLGLLLISLVFVTIRTFEPVSSNRWWLLIALTWLSAVAFFSLSDLLLPFVLFPWMAVAALLPLPWFVLNAFDATAPVNIFGFFTWGAALAAGSEVVLRLPFERARTYYWALLAGSVPLFLTSFAFAIDWATPNITFAVLVLAALVYGALHLLRRRWYLWSTALLSTLAAFFALFQLSFVERLGIPLVYQFTIAGALLVVPELFIRAPLSWRSGSRWPAIALGAVVSAFGIIVALIAFGQTGQSALAFTVYAALFTLHAVHGKRAWLGYIAAALETLALVYALDHFGLDLWLPALTALATLYYAAGFFFRRVDERKAWGHMFINSGLALGAFFSLLWLLLSKETSGWYILLVAFLFAVETFARPFAWFELAVEVLLSISLYLILDDFSVTRIGHFLFSTSLIWLGGDLIFGYLLKQKRSHRPITLGAGYGLVLMAVLVLWGESGPEVPAIYFALYAVFFAVYAILQREPRLGYLVTAFLPLALIKFCDVLNFEKWTFPLIVLAMFYYLSGYWLGRTPKAVGWDRTLLFSGLALGAVTSFSAPFQGGMDASIPVALTATLFAAEAFARRDVWWALPANAFYLMSYFMILFELNVDEPQYYSVGAALLGMLMHYLLTRAGSRTGAFLAGMLSQLVLLGTTYIQMVSTERLFFFIVLFIQSMIVLVYGIIQRSRSLVITPIVFSVIGVMTVIYSALKGLGPVILIGSTGVLLLMAGIVAVLMRERITRLGEQLSDWRP